MNLVGSLIYKAYSKPSNIRLPTRARLISNKTDTYTGGSGSVFPLEIHTSSRYLIQSNGTPFLMVGDTPWSIPVQLTNTQIDTYLADRAAKGCTAILFNAIEKTYSSQTPVYNNVDGIAPFTNMTGPNWVLNNTYWNRVDYIVNSAKDLGIVCLIAPAYMGYGGGLDGWEAEMSGSSDASLQAYGAALAARYTQGNVIWVMGGDSAGDDGDFGDYNSVTTPNRSKQWQIVVGIRTIRTTDIITGHTSRNQYGGAVDGESYNAWGGGTYVGWNLNNIYGLDNVTDMVGLSNSAYARSGPIPVFMIEAGYQDIDGSDPGGIIPAVQAMLGGARVGFFGGHDVLWHFGGYTPSMAPSVALSTYLSSSWQSYSNFGNLVKTYNWWLLEPRKDTSLVTVAPGTGNVLCPAIASDGSFALIFSPNTTSFTVNMDQFSISNIRGRWYNWETDSFVNASGTPFTNSGTQVFTSPNFNRILVLDSV